MITLRSVQKIPNVGIIRIRFCGSEVVLPSQPVTQAPRLFLYIVAHLILICNRNCKKGVAFDFLIEADISLICEYYLKLNPSGAMRQLYSVCYATLTGAP